MSKLKDTKARLQSKLEVIKKINDDPNSLVDNISDKLIINSHLLKSSIPISQIISNIKSKSDYVILLNS
jgi:hypothetical protein